jgi:hypothetical protein
MAKENTKDTGTSGRRREGRGGMSVTEVWADHLIGQSVTNRGSLTGITIGSQVLPAPTGTIVPIAPALREWSISTAAMAAPAESIKLEILVVWAAGRSLQRGSQVRLNPPGQAKAKEGIRPEGAGC